MNDKNFIDIRVCPSTMLGNVKKDNRQNRQNHVFVRTGRPTLILCTKFKLLSFIFYFCQTFKRILTKTRIITNNSYFFVIYIQNTNLLLKKYLSSSRHKSKRLSFRLKCKTWESLQVRFTRIRCRQHLKLPHNRLKILKELDECHCLTDACTFP